VTVADTWDEAACRARLAATPPGEWAHRQAGRADLHNVEDLVECGDLLIVVAPGVGTDRVAIAEFVAHAPADLEALLAEVDRLRAALIRIQGWDCLNPPRQDLLHDLPWLRRLVDEALGTEQGRPDLGGRP
jgi:hypothetical protein